MKLRTTQKHREDVIFLLIGAILTGLTVVFPEVGFLQWVSMIPLEIGRAHV